MSEPVNYNNIDDKGYEEANLADVLRFKMKREAVRKHGAEWVVKSHFADTARLLIVPKDNTQADLRWIKLDQVLVSADVRSMLDQEVRKFVRKHGPLNLKVYFNLDRTLDRAVHPETRDYFGYCTEERRQAVNKVWRMAQMVGKAFDDAFETVERDQA